MKKYLSFILAIFILLGLSVPTSATVSVQMNVERAVWTDSTNRSPLKLTQDKPIAHYFETEGVLRKYEVYCPSYSNNIGGMTINIYIWQDDYASTVASQPIATATPMDFADNALVSVPVYRYVNSGKYLAVFSNPVETVGVWKASSTLENKVNKLYINGELSANTGLDCHITTSENVFVSDINHANRKAFSNIEAESYDKKTAGITKKEGAIDIVDWRTVVSYADVDFGTTPPKGFEAKIFNYGCSDHGEMQVWIDNPISGTKIAEIYYEYRFLDREWETLTDTISEKVTGVHDVYLVFSIGGINVDRFRFLSSTPTEPFNVTRLENFTPAPDEAFDLGTDTWTATDMMGRKLPGYETVGPRDEDREIYIFYGASHAWQQTMDSQGVNNNQATLKKYLRDNPGGTEADIKNEKYYPDGSLIWGAGIKYWNESIYGYYSGMDLWLLRKHLELLSTAGVDALVFDNTNGTTTWAGGYMSLGKVMHQMHLEGIRTPNMVFWLRFGPGWESNESMRKVYQYMYSTGLYSDCWQYFDGKPLIRANPDFLLTEDTLHEDINALNLEIYDFFTFRPVQASYFLGQTLESQWPWLEVYPQHGFNPLLNSKYDYEQVAVGCAQNANDTIGLTAMNGEGVYGRSYTYKDKFSLYSDDSKYYGYNFQEQWDRAIELNPRSIFITSWNEFTMAHELNRYGVNGWAFGDNYNDEYSRDIEPVKGDFKDNYYYQMVANIRRFKGVNPTPVAGAEKTIRIGAAFSQWDTVTPEYHGFIGGTDRRYAMIKGNNGYYVNETGRNDIVLSKVARDADNLYFYVKTSENLTPYTDPSWMRLFINTDRTYKTGWEGYDFAVNIENPSSSTACTLSYTKDGWNWKPVGTLTYKYSGNQMMIRIPRETLGLSDKLIDIEFKWNDNMQNQGDIMDVYNNGDTAPIGRFAYRYTETTEYDKTPVDEPVTVSDLKLNQHKHSVILAIGKDTAFAEGKQKTLDASPEIINDKTMIPLRFFSEGFGAEVSWNDSTRTATVKLDGRVAVITVGKATMTANGEEKALESPAVIKNGRTLVPMRDIAEALGKKVLWVDGGLIIAGENPETVHSYEWVQDMTEDNLGIR